MKDLLWRSEVDQELMEEVGAFPHECFAVFVASISLLLSLKISFWCSCFCQWACLSLWPSICYQCKPNFFLQICYMPWYKRGGALLISPLFLHSSSEPCSPTISLLTQTLSAVTFQALLIPVLVGGVNESPKKKDLLLNVTLNKGWQRAPVNIVEIMEI